MISFHLNQFRLFTHAEKIHFHQKSNRFTMCPVKIEKNTIRNELIDKYLVLLNTQSHKIPKEE